MTYDWRLLAYYIRKPCAACKLPLDLQEWLYQQYQNRKPIREIEGDLLRMGYPIGDHTLYKHRQHQAILIERLSAKDDPNRARIERELLKLRIEELRLQRERERALHEALEILRKELPPERFDELLRIIETP